ncbi:MAG: 1-acyl-sn-glycerol-3-phosphate acyltransferase [Chitinophagaceae bacterium]|nr:1-acyl-sn-glycerol-3-phosphate acyltransferase [Chitinophagaceae bacterium]
MVHFVSVTFISMRAGYRFLQIIYCIWALLWFIIIMLVVFPFIIILALTQNIKAANVIYKLCSLWGHAWYLTSGLLHEEIYETPHDKSRQYIFVGNHISYMDIPPIVMSIHQPVRVLGKAEMVKLPVFGQIYKAAVILVERGNTDKRAKSVRALKSALRHGISIFIFPEGTFNETGQPLKDFFDGAFRIAIETQTPIKPILFIDTLDRMHYRGLFELTPGPCRVVYLDEIPVDDYTMKDVKALKQKVYSIMEAGLMRWKNKVKIEK